MMQVKSGVWVRNSDPEVRILIERVYKSKDYVDYFYFMCKYTGGGRITKAELLDQYTIEKRNEEI